jgi:hypothetical protein
MANGGIIHTISTNAADDGVAREVGIGRGRERASTERRRSVEKVFRACRNAQAAV